MRKLLILMALAILTASHTGCSRCRGLFRRGAPCGGTALTAPPMLGGAIPVAGPLRMQQAVPQGIIVQPGGNCEQQCAPCDPCNTCDPCQSGYMGGTSYGNGYGNDCGCQVNPGEFFGGYVEGSGTIGAGMSGGIRNDPRPVNP